MTLSFDAFGLNIFDIQEQELSVKLVSKETPGQFE
jgi:hypothetical protein